MSSSEILLDWSSLDEMSLQVPGALLLLFLWTETLGGHIYKAAHGFHNFIES